MWPSPLLLFSSERQTDFFMCLWPGLFPWGAHGLLELGGDYAGAAAWSPVEEALSWKSQSLGAAMSPFSQLSLLAAQEGGKEKPWFLFETLSVCD